MTIVFDTLRASTVAEELDDVEVGTILHLFDVLNFQTGELIVKPGEERPDDLFIVAEGEIEVQFNSGGSAQHPLQRGDLAGMITFVGGSSSQISATLCAESDVKVLSLEQRKVEELVKTHPMIVYRLMRGVARSMQGIVRRGNIQTARLSNYIHRFDGVY